MENGSNGSSKLDNNHARIKVFGIGGGGSNAVNNMIRSGLEGVQFVTANTDAQALASNLAPLKIKLGDEITKGLGAGADPEIGRAAARESIERIREQVSGADMVFITAGMGGGTGTGGAEIVAEVAKELGALTVAVVTKPFMFEGKRRQKNAEIGIEALKRHVDTLITIPNQRLLSVAGRNTSLLETFRRADDILYQAVKGISDLIVFEGLINVDFADVRAVMSEMGMAMMGTGEASGENRAIEAAEKAVSSPLLEDISIHGARGVLINVTASPDVTLQEVNEAAELIHQEAHEEANIIWGMVIDPNMQDKVRVTVIATGFGDRTESDETTVTMTSIGGNQSSYAQSSGSHSGSHAGSQSSYSQGNYSLGQPQPVIPQIEPVRDARKLDIPPFARKASSSSSQGGSQSSSSSQHSSQHSSGGEVIKLKKLSVLSSTEDEEKYEIPTFLRKQVD